MGQSKAITSNLNIIKELCEELENFFEAFTMDRVWSTDNSKVTVCFTAEQIKGKTRLPSQREEPFRY